LTEKRAFGQLTCGREVGGGGDKRKKKELGPRKGRKRKDATAGGNKTAGMRTVSWIKPKGHSKRVG